MSKTNGLTTADARKEKFGLRNPSIFEEEKEAKRENYLPLTVKERNSLPKAEQKEFETRIYDFAAGDEKLWRLGEERKAAEARLKDAYYIGGATYREANKAYNEIDARYKAFETEHYTKKYELEQIHVNDEARRFLNTSLPKIDELISKYEAKQNKSAEDNANLYYLRGMKSFLTLSEEEQTTALRYLGVFNDEGAYAFEDRAAAYAIYESLGGDNFDRMAATLCAVENSMTSAKRDVANARFASGHPVLSSMASVFTNLLGGIDAAAEILDTSVDNLFEDEEYKQPIDMNSRAFTLKDGTNVIRNTVSDKIERGAGESAANLYDLGMEVADFGAASVVGGNFASTLLGTDAAVDGFMEAKERGADDTRAAVTGAVTGVVERIFEGESISQLFKTDKIPMGKIKKAVIDVLGNSLDGANSSFSSSLSNSILDFLINGGHSEYMQAFSKAYASGQSEKEARKTAINKIRDDILSDTADGSITGLVEGIIEKLK